MLIINKFTVAFSVFSVILAILNSARNIGYTIVSFKAFAFVNLSVYSVFAMLGGMMLPFVYGMLFEGEPITVWKFLSIIIITISLFITVDFKQKSKGIIYFLAVFVLNGFSGIISAFHQRSPFSAEYAVDSASFTALSAIFSLIFCAALLLIRTKKIPAVNFKPFIFATGAGLLNTFANYILLITIAGGVQSSIQYTMVTGGTMVMSLIISLIRKENITLKNLISTFLALVATVIVIF